jgi:hypothetical protein
VNENYPHALYGKHPHDWFLGEPKPEPDPAAEIKAMREVVEAAAQVRSEIETGDCVANGERSHQELARSLDALAALKAESKVKNG